MSHHQNAGQSHNVVQFKYLDTTVAKQVTFTKKLGGG